MSGRRWAAWSVGRWAVSGRPLGQTAVGRSFGQSVNSGRWPSWSVGLSAVSRLASQAVSLRDG